jgi:hypothetical protein
MRGATTGRVLLGLTWLVCGCYNYAGFQAYSAGQGGQAGQMGQMGSSGAAGQASAGSSGAAGATGDAPGIVRCGVGSLLCDTRVTDERCCLSDPPACSTSLCGPGLITLSCDGSEDCPGTMSCCYAEGVGGHCAPECASAALLCHHSSDCRVGASYCCPFGTPAFRVCSATAGTGCN